MSLPQDWEKRVGRIREHGFEEWGADSDSNFLLLVAEHFERETLERAAGQASPWEQMIEEKAREACAIELREAARGLEKLADKNKDHINEPGLRFAGSLLNRRARALEDGAP